MSGELTVVFGDAGSLYRNPKAGGHWSAMLQFLIGLNALGHRTLLMEVTDSETLGPSTRVQEFLRRTAGYGVTACVVVRPISVPDADVEDYDVHGVARSDFLSIVRDADLLLNNCGWVRQPLLGRFRRSAYLDLDPGHVQIAFDPEAVQLRDNAVHLTIGTNVGVQGDSVPGHGVEWRHIDPVVHLPMWPLAPRQPDSRGFTSVSQWSWNQLWLQHGELLLSDSKREAYLRYADLPSRTDARFELAVNLPDVDSDPTGDMSRMRAGGWNIVPADLVTDTPERYRAYIQQSDAEFLCPKPVFVQLSTGWVSDRSVCYLASGRPVVAEDTGFGRHLSLDGGLVGFSDHESALAAVDDVMADWTKHCKAARAVAEEVFSSTRSLPKLLEHCG